MSLKHLNAGGARGGRFNQIRPERRNELNLFRCPTYFFPLRSETFRIKMKDTRVRNVPFLAAKRFFIMVVSQLSRENVEKFFNYPGLG